ncbi:MAG: hypothetical protein LBJ09_04055 [Clostridiales bacterium]|jgi:uncharacterized membrane protein|nr:hypothetical protein [Clostridiales bacterium]
MISFIVIVLYIFAFIFDFLPILKSRKKTEISVYSFILAVSFIILFFETIGFRIPRLSPIMESFARKVTKR